MDIRSFIYWLADHAPPGLRTVARWIADRIFAVWDDVSQIFRLARPSWLRLAQRMWDNIRVVRYAIGEIASTLRWITTVKVPQAVSRLWDDITHWVLAQLNLLRDFTTGLYRTVRDEFFHNLNLVLDALNGFQHWVTQQISDLWKLLTSTASRVASLLGDPNRLAAWLVGAMFTALLTLVRDHADALADYVWARRERIIVSLIGRVEAWLARVL